MHGTLVRLPDAAIIGIGVVRNIHLYRMGQGGPGKHYGIVRGSANEFELIFRHRAQQLG